MKIPKLLIGFLVALIVVTTITFATIQYLNNDMSKYVKIDVIKTNNDGFIFLGNNNCTGILAKTSIERVESIQLGLENKIQNRPNTHDIFSETLKYFNITLEKVIINKLEDNTYFSYIIFKQGNKILELDAKPSDAIALALRTNSSIYVNRTLFNKRKISIC